MSARPWSEAWHAALYGPGGFFLRSRPLDHFRTNVENPLYAEAVRSLAERVDAALGQPDPFDLVDLGAGGGELLRALSAVGVASRWRLTGVDLAPRPVDLPAEIGWSTGQPGARGTTGVIGLLLANEWLDSVPLDVVVDGRLVLVEPDGTEQLGPAAAGEELAWAARWWPGGGRVEIGRSRDRAWADAVAQLRRGLAVAVDYGHVSTTRRSTLTGYRAGRQVRPVPDGTQDLTAHVAFDACAAATRGRLLRQADALAWLGISAGLPAATDPSYVVGLQRAAQGRELLDAAGLGGFTWLVQEVGLPAGSILP